MLDSLLRVMRQERFARILSRQALDGFDSVHRLLPELDGEALYERVLSERFGVDHATACQVIEGARSSFAQWPVARDLTFCDVVHYFVTDRCLSEQAAAEEHWLRGRIGQVVRSVIPQHL